MFKYIVNKMELLLKPLGCEVRGVDLKVENRPESKFIFKLKIKHLLWFHFC